MTNPRRLTLMLAAAAALAQAAPAEALQRYCRYDVMVKSDSERIGSFAIPNGRIESVGDMRRQSIRGFAVVPAEGARRLAARAARTCVRDAATHAATPPSCRINRNPSDFTAAMSQYNLPNLRVVALNALCNQVRVLGKGTRVRTYQIWLSTRGDGDVRRQCKPDDPVIDIGRDLTCQDGLAGGRNEAAHLTRWFAKSRTEIEAIIRDYCYRTFNMTRYRVVDWEVARDGKLRARYRCQ